MKAGEAGGPDRDQRPGEARILAAGLLSIAVTVLAGGAVAGAVLRSHATAVAEGVLVVLGGVALLTCWGALLQALPMAPPRPRRRPAPPPERLAELERLENVVGFAGAQAVDLQYLLRPVLREVAASRLAVRGVALDADPRAAALLGPDAWELLRPDRPEPLQPHGPGLPRRRLAGILGVLEAL